MDEADDLVVAVQSILEHVQAEFGAAGDAADDGAGRWVGVDADARLRLARRIRDEVNRLAAVFGRVRATIDAVPGGRLTAAELDAALAAERAELMRLEATKASVDALLREFAAPPLAEAPAAAAQPNR